MCGIIGYIGKKQNVIDLLINGLKSLEYRGYDSAGIAYLEQNEIKVIKAQGKISSLEEKTKNLNVLSTLGIGHTRWATHGKPSNENSHPHRVGRVTLIHNGIIENYQELKEMLIKEGYTFQSQTDTEVVAGLLDFYLKQENDKLTILHQVISMLKGSFALGIIFDDDFNHLYAVRKDNPLILGTTSNMNFIASDIPAIIKYTNQYILLENKDIAILSEEKIQVFDENLNPVNREKLTSPVSIEEAKKAPYEHFMLKEIMEEATLLEKLYSLYGFGTPSFLEKLPDLSKYEKIHIVACGSAMYAGLVGKYMMEEYADIETNVYVASEYRYQKNFYSNKTLVIFISQSGETADTIACLRLVKQLGIDTLALVNVYGSTIAREVDKVLYLYAGVEIAVATTKAYLLQVALLSMLVYHTALAKDLLSEEEQEKIKMSILELPKILDELLKKGITYEASQILSKASDVFFLGRGIDYATSLEGSLKLKEISYLHSEAYQAGELKHGTISLIEQGMPVVTIITDERLIDKTLSNMKEVKSRGAYNILITTKDWISSDDSVDLAITVKEVNPLVQSLLIVPILQLLAYHTAKIKGCDIDQPRNLAKSVTVE